MNNVTRKSSTSSKAILPMQRSYSEIVDVIDAAWKPKSELNLAQFKELDKALGFPSKAVPYILVGGTNGKGLTINFSTQLLQREGLKVGSFYTPRVLTYNEQFAINNESIINKQFTDVANEVINTALTNNIAVSAHEILAMIALVYFRETKVDVALVELLFGAQDPLTICNPKILAITRVTDDIIPNAEFTPNQIIKDLIAHIKPGTIVASADQSKTHLQLMQEETKKQSGAWAMPVRKLAALPYPFEQLHGRCAALAERIGQLYIEETTNNNSMVVLDNSLLAKQKGQRGRPTLEAKRHAELNPKKTIDQFWQETAATLPARFEVLDKEKPTILLDPSPNVDALKNLLLGVRLLNYQKPIKGIAFIFAFNKKQLQTEEFLRQLRYFSKRNSAHVIFCPISEQIPGLFEESWNVEAITNEVKAYKIKARAAANFEEAFTTAKQLVDERNGLVVIAGSHSIISEYWRSKGMKKL